MENKSQLRLLILVLFIVLVVGIRVITPLSPNFKFLANMTAIGAVAIFSGAYFKNALYRNVFPLAVLLLSDIGLTFTMGTDYGFYSGWYYTYIAFALIILTSHLMMKKINVQNVLTSSIVAVLIHWIVTDFGVWLGSGMYPQTLVGFWTCLVAAIPFELNFLYGTLIYSAIMFVAFEALKSKYNILSLERVK